MPGVAVGLTIGYQCDAVGCCKVAADLEAISFSSPMGLQARD
jgi:hypothetical protein